MRNTPNPGRPVETPLPSEADIEIGRATPHGKPAAAQDKPAPPRNATVGDGRPTRRWSETVEAEQEQRAVPKSGADH